MTETTPADSTSVTSAGESLSQGKVLRQLYLKLFLRGRSARGLQTNALSGTVPGKIRLLLLLYALLGATTLPLMGQSVFTLSVYLHGFTLFIVGLFVAASAGEVLFNRDDADILLHRPINTQTLLWSKIHVLIVVTLWFAGAFNLVGMWLGVRAADGGWYFLLAHVISTIMLVLFSISAVVVVYELCLRWFGREKLDGLMTTVQVLTTILFVVGGQLAPQLMQRTDDMGGAVSFLFDAWWISLLPPAWFAGVDDVLDGQASGLAWQLAATAFASTALFMWLAFSKLAQGYSTGLQTLAEASAARPRLRRRRWFDALINTPPMRVWLRDSVARSSFLLCAAYLVRDRELKLRVYPAIVPMMLFPFLMMFGTGSRGGFGIAFSTTYIALVPWHTVSLLGYSQQWAASDIFRLAPTLGPASICHGARRAVLFVITLPALVLITLVAYFVAGPGHLAFLIPGVMLLPLFAIIPQLRGKSIPLSHASETATGAERGLLMLMATIVGGVVSGIAITAWSFGFFGWFLLLEAVIVAFAYWHLRSTLTSLTWPPLE
jgi:ABC-2 type transport system permease protein